MHSDLLSFLFTANASFNPMTLIAVGLAPQIEAAVEYFKANWFLPHQLAPYAATVLSVLVQVGVCVSFHIPLSASIVGVIATTAATCWWHELSS